MARKPVLKAAHSPVIIIVWFFRENNSKRVPVSMLVADPPLPAVVSSEPMSVGFDVGICFPESNALVLPNVIVR